MIGVDMAADRVMDVSVTAVIAGPITIAISRVAIAVSGIAITIAVSGIAITIAVSGIAITIAVIRITIAVGRRGYRATD